MEKLILYLVLLVLMLVWVLVYRSAPALQGLLIIVSICGVSLSCACRKTREG